MKNTKKQPDWITLRKIGNALEKADHAGTLTKAQWNSYLQQAQQASAGEGQLTEFVFLYENSWAA